MKNWNNSDELANEYANDLKGLKTLYNDYKNKMTNCLEKEKECEECGLWDASQEWRLKYEAYRLDAKEISSIISSSEYAIKWLRSGEEPRNATSITQLSYEQRTVYVSDVDQALMYLNTLKTDYPKMDKEQLHELHIFLHGMSVRERDVFVSIKGKGNTLEETAGFLEIGISSVRNYLKRAEKKVEKYIEKGVQTALF